MEYVKNIIIESKYADLENNKECIRKSWTSKLKEKIKKNKLFSVTIILCLSFLLLDLALIFNFMKIFSTI